jgi:hypothetical protein
MQPYGKSLKSCLVAPPRGSEVTFRFCCPRVCSTASVVGMGCNTARRACRISRSISVGSGGSVLRSRVLVTGWRCAMLARHAMRQSCRIGLLSAAWTYVMRATPD